MKLKVNIDLNVHTDTLVPFIFLWGIPIVMVVREYLKMDADDRKSAMSDFRSPRFILTSGFVVFGAFLAHLGFLFATSIVEIIGLSIFASGAIFSAISTWKKSKMRSALILVLVAIAIFLVR